MNHLENRLIPAPIELAAEIVTKLSGDVIPAGGINMPKTASERRGAYMRTDLMLPFCLSEARHLALETSSCEKHRRP